MCARRLAEWLERDHGASKYAIIAITGIWPGDSTSGRKKVGRKRERNEVAMKHGGSPGNHKTYLAIVLIKAGILIDVSRYERYD